MTPAAMFCHLAAAISRQDLDLAGTLLVLLDVDDHAVVAVDIRLTDALDSSAARELINKAVAELDAGCPTLRPTEIETVLWWPHYQLSPTEQPIAALSHGATVTGFDVRPKTCRPVQHREPLRHPQHPRHSRIRRPICRASRH